MGDRWDRLTCGDHFNIMYANVKLLHSTHETNIILYINYISIKRNNNMISTDVQNTYSNSMYQ